MPREVFVFIPTFNCERFICKTIESVLAQTYTNWEALVLDDCSTDRTFEIASQYSQPDGRIRVLKNDSNLGMVNNWNKGITFCKSNYFVKLDGDDTWAPEMLAKAIQILEDNPEVGLVFSSYVNIDLKDEIIKGSRPVFPGFAQNKSFSCIPLVQEGSMKMLSYPILRQGLSAMRTRIFAQIGGYRFLLTKSTQASADTEFYFRLGCHFKIYCVDDVLYYYRVHPESISSRDQNEGLQQKKMYEVKLAIINHYFHQNKINKTFWRDECQEIAFRYNVFKNYLARKDRKQLSALGYTLRLLLFHPIRTWHHFFERSQNWKG
jgi:glycosyltransferase involved in cell wall biosynthesis